MAKQNMHVIHGECNNHDDIIKLCEEAVGQLMKGPLLNTMGMTMMQMVAAYEAGQIEIRDLLAQSMHYGMSLLAINIIEGGVKIDVVPPKDYQKEGPE